MAGGPSFGTAAPERGVYRGPTYSPYRQQGKQNGVQGSSGGAAAIPPSYYNPTWDEQLAAGNRETKHTIQELEQKGSYGLDDYGISKAEQERGQRNSLEELATSRTHQHEAGQKALAQLAESYKKLGVRQNEGANTAGVLYGGAVLQSAAKRAYGEGVQKTGTEHALAQQTEADNTREQRIKEGGESALGKLGLSNEREQHEINEVEIPYARENIEAFEGGINRHKSEEATARGYSPVSPLVKAAVKAKAPTRFGTAAPTPHQFFGVTSRTPYRKR